MKRKQCFNLLVSNGTNGLRKARFQEARHKVLWNSDSCGKSIGKAKIGTIATTLKQSIIIQLDMTDYELNLPLLVLSLIEELSQSIKLIQFPSNDIGTVMR